MRPMRVMIALLFLGSLCRAESPLPPAATQPARSLFNPSRHMLVSEVKPGMKGYGLSVFSGTAIERFDVEVLSILKNFNPRHDVILIKCHGANLEHTGTIAGMSGSPIYLTDSRGRSRMIGALAYGWPLMKDPVAGVQPIQYMLEIPASTDSANPGPLSHNPSASPRTTWSLSDAIPLPGAATCPPTYPLASWNVFSPNPRLSTGRDDAARLQPLSTPLMTAGLSPRLLEQFAPLFRSTGLVPLQAGGSTAAAPGDDCPRLEPGSVLAIPLVTGDLEMSAIGTCTEVLDNHVFGFGHPFNNEGPVSLPMGSGQINAVIANLTTSFKIGSLSSLRGTLSADQMVGVGGQLGQSPPTAPVDLRVVYSDGSMDQNYHFNIALHPRLTPMVSLAALSAAASGVRELPQYHTLDYDLDMTFANGKSLHVNNTAVNDQAADLFFEIAGPLIAAAENPFERVLVKSIRGTLRVTPEARLAQVLSVDVPREKFRPGETVKGFVSYRPFRAAEAILPLELELPRDIADGKYQLAICDWQKFLETEAATKPFRFTAQNIDEVFAVLKDLSSFRHDALYLRLVREPDGVAVGRTAMPYLPSSRRQVLLGAGRSNTTAFVSSTVKVVPTPVVMNGSAEFTITIDKDAKVEPAGQRPAKSSAKDNSSAPSAKPDSKAGDSKPRPGLPEAQPAPDPAPEH